MVHLPHPPGANKYAIINDALNYYQLTSFQQCLYLVGLSPWIATGQPDGVSVFAPTNAAFAALLAQAPGLTLGQLCTSQAGAGLMGHCNVRG